MSDTSLDALRDVIQKHWGFHSFRPLQEDAMRAVLDRRDSVVVMPTGGGKSLCYQAPAVLQGGVTVVVSPLIALMKDQVDGLRACGVPAAQLDSSLSAAERYAYELDLTQGAVRLLFVSPERILSPDFLSLLGKIDVHTVAIDEAHCVSHWGHDFRPEYRQLSRVRDVLPRAAVHAFTATATEQVRDDICRQLALRDPLVLVGNFDRPNLTYRVLPKFNLEQQIIEVLDRHRGEAGIIYCLRRKDVDDVNAMLQGLGHRAFAYHAGMNPDDRRRAQEAFAEEQCDLIVATVAFGMGIDRSNIRFILHTAVPKSVEHYQQETGRAGRDGLEAECVLLYSGGDIFTWRSILEKSAQEHSVAPDFLPNALKHVDDIDRYCRGALCRHRALVEYFGQPYEGDNCGACDLCLGDVEQVPDAKVVAQKILSCVARVQERFGIGHVIGILRGENTERIRSFKHDALTTYGLLKEHSKNHLRDWVYQLISQGLLRQEGLDYPILKLTPAAWEVMRGQRDVRLTQPVARAKGEKAKASKVSAESWEGVDRGLFDALRAWRAELAKQTQKPAYIIFGDHTLRELARLRPSTSEALRLVYGVGEAKLRELGPQVLPLIAEYCRRTGIELDVPDRPRAPAPTAPPKPASGVKLQAYTLFRQGLAVEDVMHQTGRARNTVMDYLADYIRAEKPDDVSPWVTRERYDQVAQAARRLGTARLKPIYLELGEAVSYDEIRVVLAHLARNESAPPPS